VGMGLVYFIIGFLVFGLYGIVYTYDTLASSTLSFAFLCFAFLDSPGL
jgi:hypothetical protein